jgi:hypothetical protein
MRRDTIKPRMQWVTHGLSEGGQEDRKKRGATSTCTGSWLVNLLNYKSVAFVIMQRVIIMSQMQSNRRGSNQPKTKWEHGLDEWNNKMRKMKLSGGASITKSRTLLRKYTYSAEEIRRRSFR